MNSNTRRTHKDNSGVLYTSYSGMLEPLGQSQVLANQERLSDDHPVHLISFERREDWINTDQREIVARRMIAAGINWHPLRYHKRLSAVSTAWDIFVGAIKGCHLVYKYGLSIIHARSYVSSAMALVIKRLTPAKYIFDMRGFWVDERVDGGLWPRDGRMFRVGKWFERRFLLEADHVISVTNAAVSEMAKFPYLNNKILVTTVIPTCADLERFKPIPGMKSSSFVLGYVGSAGTWYKFEEVAKCFRHLLEIRPSARFLIINRESHDFIRQSLADQGIPSHCYEIRTAAHEEVPAQMARMDAGIFFIKPVFSKIASAPTKLAEFLGCGIPCLANTGVGDMAEIIEGDGVGVAINAFDSSALIEGLQRLLILTESPGISDRCTSSAKRNFSLDRGVELYRSAYRAVNSCENQ